ncbi:MAG: hypothetical protein HY562_01575 [Ignavibacteriales bacterium]|nr:hypothetical protein [Ignavibacteriales bacterium]
MFLGHYAVALAAKKAAPQTSLATLFVAVQLVHHLWPILLLLGLEQASIEPGITVVTPLNFIYYPYSHSLIAFVIYSAVFATIYFAVTNYKRGAAMVALGVFSHWVLDVLTHRPDMPIGFSNVKLGLGLWNSLEATVAVEAVLFLCGIVTYLKTTKSRNWKGMAGFWLLIVVLAGIYYANLFGPPPPSILAVAIAGNAGWLFVVWAFWVDRNRQLAGQTCELPEIARRCKGFSRFRLITNSNL